MVLEINKRFETAKFPKNLAENPLRSGKKTPANCFSHPNITQNTMGRPPAAVFLYIKYANRNIL